MLTISATVQIRPQVIAQGMPGQVQNVQIIQGPQGQLQVRGLLPGMFCVLFFFFPPLLL